MIISFHSLEDRIVKDAMREGAKQGHYRLLTKKPVTAERRRDRSQSAVAQREAASRRKSLDPEQPPGPGADLMTDAPGSSRYPVALW